MRSAADIDLGVGDAAFLEDVASVARAAGATARVHLKIDTGLHRNGVRPEDWAGVRRSRRELLQDGGTRCDVVGVWSHIAEASDEEDDAARARLRRRGRRGRGRRLRTRGAPPGRQRRVVRAPRVPLRPRARRGVLLRHPLRRRARRGRARHPPDRLARRRRSSHVGDDAVDRRHRLACTGCRRSLAQRAAFTVAGAGVDVQHVGARPHTRGRRRGAGRRSATRSPSSARDGRSPPPTSPRRSERSARRSLVRVSPLVPRTLPRRVSA